MGTFTSPDNLYKPALAEEGWGDEVNTNFDTIQAKITELGTGGGGTGTGLKNVMDYGAVGDGVTDDTQAFRDAIAASLATGGSVYLPCGPSWYQLTETIDLTNFIGVHIVGGNRIQNRVQGAVTPTAVINSTAPGAAFYSSEGSLTFENLSVYAVRTAFHFQDCANLTFKHVSAQPANTGHADNASMLFENCFWIRSEHGAYHAPVNTKPAVIFRGKEPRPDVGTSYLIFFSNTTLWKGGISWQQYTQPEFVATAVFVDVLLENAGTYPLFAINEANMTGPWHFNGLEIRHAQSADPQGGAQPLIVIDAPNLILEGPVFQNLVCPGAIAVKIYSGTVNGALFYGSVDEANFMVDTSIIPKGSYISMQNNGWTICSSPADPTLTDMYEPAQGGALKLGRSGHVHASASIDTDGRISWGPGGATGGIDTNLYRANPNMLKTDDKFLATAGLGVGNSVAASSLGSVAKKMEIFDASGNSLGFIPIYSSIT